MHYLVALRCHAFNEVVLVSLPGFVFRAAANICRLISILTRKETLCICK